MEREMDNMVIILKKNDQNSYLSTFDEENTPSRNNSVELSESDHKKFVFGLKKYKNIEGYEEDVGTKNINKNHWSPDKNKTKNNKIHSDKKSETKNTKQHKFFKSGIQTKELVSDDDSHDFEIVEDEEVLKSTRNTTRKC